jgi:hypothetical protein
MCWDRKAIPTCRTRGSNFSIHQAGIFTLIYSASGALQRERGYALLSEATSAYEDLLIAVIDGSLDPSQPVFRQDLED